MQDNQSLNPYTNLFDRKTRSFIEHFIISMNVADSSRKANISATTGFGLLNNENVVMAIRWEMQKTSEDLKIRKEDILKALIHIAEANLLDYVSWDAYGNIRIIESERLTRAQGYSIKSIKVTRKPNGETSTELKLEDKIPALKLIAEMLGFMNKDDFDPEKEGAGVMSLIEALGGMRKKVIEEKIPLDKAREMIRYEPSDEIPDAVDPIKKAGKECQQQ